MVWFIKHDIAIRVWELDQEDTAMPAGHHPKIHRSLLFDGASRRI